MSHWRFKFLPTPAASKLIELSAAGDRLHVDQLAIPDPTPRTFASIKRLVRAQYGLNKRSLLSLKVRYRLMQLAYLRCTVLLLILKLPDRFKTKCL